MAHIFYICADILDRRECHGREYFMGANISWAQIFHGREYFMGANNLGYAQIFQDVRIYLIGSEHFDMRRYFEDVCIHF